MAPKSYLSELPVEILLDNLLPLLPSSDLLNLGCTNRSFARLCNDETLWHHKLLVDFNFTGAGTARSSGWKFIYKGLDRPKVYVWGDRRNGRLGLSKYSRTYSFGVPVPTRLTLPGVRIVNLVAGGWSFHALDSEGNIHVWGTMNSESMALRSEGFSESGKTAYTPKRLVMPSRARSISCGRMHSSTLDSNNNIWTFVSWGRPFRLSSPIFSDPDFAPIQVECGWMFSCVLVKSGDVFAWWPFSGTMLSRIERQNRSMNNRRDSNHFANEVDGNIPCATWDMDVDPVRLPSLPPLPDLGESSRDDKKLETKLVKIAGFDGHIIGLTNKGHVLKFRGLDNEETVPVGQWTYLPKFSETSLVREHSVFSDSEHGLDPPESLRITHVSANFLTFVAYSTGSNSIVLMGDTDTTDESQPKIIPALQNRDVISVVLGDYHNAALTADGKLYTWGAYSAGALGLGEPVNGPSPEPGRRRMGEPGPVHVPTEVKFGHGGKEKFCLAVTAAGWHTGALVIDLEPGGSESDEESVTSEPQSEVLPPPPHGIRQPGQSPPFVPLPSIFRLGFAGRHAGRGHFSGGGSSGGRS